MLTASHIWSQLTPYAKEKVSNAVIRRYGDLHPVTAQFNEIRGQDNAPGFLTERSVRNSSVLSKLLVTVHKQVEAAKAELGKPFPQEAELRTKSGRLAVLDAELNMDKQTGREQPKKKEQER